MISCDQHDYIEIACMYRYLIRLKLKSDTLIKGIALDTVRNDAREECIKLNVDNKETLVVLEDIQRLEACNENPHFKTVHFS